MDGSLDSQPDKERLAHTVLDVDTDSIEEGMLVQEAFNRSLSTFLPDMMFKELVTNYKNAKKLYGQTIIRELTGYDSRYVDKNIKIPEFQRELQKRLKDKADELHEEGILTKGGQFTKDSLIAAALFMIDEEFKQAPLGYSSYGEPSPKAANNQGERSDVRKYKKGDPYKDLAVRQSISRALKRGRTELSSNDLHSYDRESRQKINIIYALDTSGSMKGDKIRLAKKAGVSLAHRAIHDHNEVGLILFGHKIQTKVELTKDFFTFVQPLATCIPSNETDLGLAIETGIELLQGVTGIKHIVLLTDGLHTTSKDPRKAVMEQVGLAQHQDISISVVGINLDTLGLEMAEDIVDMSQGNLYAVQDLKDVGGIIIADYAQLQNK